jgi:hypothetical protein
MFTSSYYSTTGGFRKRLLAWPRVGKPPWAIIQENNPGCRQLISRYGRDHAWPLQSSQAAAGSDYDCFCRPGEGICYLVCLSRRCEDNVARWNPAELAMHVDTIAFILHANPSQLANMLYKLIQLVLPCRHSAGTCGSRKVSKSILLGLYLMGS